MRVVWKSIVASAAFIGLAGCGGSSSGGGGQNNNPYSGSYRGEYLQSNGTYGTVAFSVTTDGVLSGGTANQSGGIPAPFTITGGISSTGSANITGFGGSTDIGSFNSPSGTTIEAALTNSSGSATVWMTLVANPTAPPGSGNPFAGDYMGSILNTATNLTGIDAWTITTSGALSGSAVVDNAGTPTLATVSGNVSALGTVTYTVTAGTTTVTTVSGTISLSSGNLTGMLTNSAGNTLRLTATQISD